MHPKHRGNGVGKRLLQHAILLAGRNPTLYVARSNQPAVGLYQNHGFEVTREFEADYNGRAVMASEMVRHSTANPVD
nr:N-acetyltransferase [Saccharospirillum impatiens]